MSSGYLIVVPARIVPPTTGVEIDARTIEGNGGQVHWHLEEGRHVVTVTDAGGAVQARLRAADGRTAHELFEHPFASARVPNLFERTGEPA